MKLVIIGFATSYKSTVAKHLSHKLNIPLLDIDKLVETQAGATIAQIFAEQGESHFRTLESQVMLDLSQMDDCVISCGGGSVLSPDFPKLCQNATVLWLRVDAKSAHKRLNGHTRPLFDNLTEQQLAHKIAERTPLYAKYANLTLDTSAKGSKQVLAEACKLLNIN